MFEIINKTYYEGTAITFEISETGNVALWVNGDMEARHQFTNNQKAIKYIFLKFLDILCMLPQGRLDELFVWQPRDESPDKFHFYEKYLGFQYSELFETPDGEPIATFLRPKLLCSALYTRYSNKYHQSKLGAPI